MYSGFDLSFSPQFFSMIENNSFKALEYYYTIGNQSFTKVSENELRDYLFCVLNEDTLDAESIQNDWFPQVDADIFLSHSHDDLKLATAFAGFLYKEMGLKVFIDSHIWGYVDILLEQINQKYSDRRYTEYGGIVYDHNKCKKVSQHVYIMLLMALQDMIDNVESVFFLNTKNSIHAVNKNRISETYSPWIYSELMCAKTIRRKQLTDYGRVISENCSYLQYETRSLRVNYKLSLNHLIKIGEEDIIRWFKTYKESDPIPGYPLDSLYKIKSFK